MGSNSNLSMSNPEIQCDHLLMYCVRSRPSRSPIEHSIDRFDWQLLSELAESRGPWHNLLPLQKFEIPSSINEIAGHIWKNKRVSINKDLTFNFLKHSREKELEADSLGLEIFKRSWEFITDLGILVKSHVLEYGSCCTDWGKFEVSYIKRADPL